MEFISKELDLALKPIDVSEEDDGESRYVTCEQCDRQIDCYNDNINIVYKGGDSVNNPHEELVLCTMCFHDMKDELKQQDYKCDDWDVEEVDEGKTEIYHLTADYKKSTYQTEQWNNELSNGKHVRFEITNYFYWGTFEIELTDKEKEEILKKKSIILNDYSGVSVESLDSGCDYYEEIRNKDSYTEEELKEIHRLLYLDRYHHTRYTSDCDDDVDQDILELNGWSMDETIYGIDTGCELVCIS